MGYDVSRISEAKGATIRYVVWDVLTSEFYPSDFDTNYRFIQFMSIRTSKDTALATRFANIRLQREGFPVDVRLYSRFYNTTEETTTPANLQAGEIMSFSDTFFTPSNMIIGAGVLMPQRSRLNATVSSISNFDVLLEMVIVEARSPEALSVFI